MEEEEMSFEAKAKELGIEIPVPGKPTAAYEPGVLIDNMIYISGQLPMLNKELQYKGVVGKDVTQEEAYQGARICVINALGVIKSLVGSLDRIEKIVKVEGFVNSLQDVTYQPACINGASDLLGEIFGDVGKHARFAIGTSGLPLGSSVEVGMIVKVK
jgi:enamine deaminase RidA (YjgF/YER057c/UK114 family)